MKKLNSLDLVTLILVIVGGLNWLLVGLFNFDLVSAIFGEMSMITRVVYSLVGVSAVYVLAVMSSFQKK